MRRSNGWIVFGAVVFAVGTILGCGEKPEDASSKPPKPVGVPVESDPNVSAKDQQQISAAKEQAEAQGNAYARDMAAKYNKK